MNAARTRLAEEHRLSVENLASELRTLFPAARVHRADPLAELSGEIWYADRDG